MSISDAITRAICSPDYILEVRMPLFSKARPRMTKSGHAYMPQAYRNAQEEMRRQLRDQWPYPALEGPIALYIKMYGEGRLDADNAAGAALDAVGPSKGRPGMIWVDDRVTVIPCMVIEWERAPKAESRWVIQIAKL